MKIDQKNAEERNRLGKFLLSVRRQGGISLKEAAKRAGISFTYLSQIERGERMPSRDVIANLAHAYGVDEQAVIREAGYLEAPVIGITAERIDWAFGAVCRDCNYQFGMDALVKPLDTERKALIVEIYQDATGRQLLNAPEESAVQKALATKPDVPKNSADKFWDQFTDNVEICRHYRPELSRDVAGRALLLELVRRMDEEWGKPKKEEK